MFALQTVDLSGLDALGAHVQLREQSYGVVRPILTGGFARKNELLFVVSLFVDGEPFGRATETSGGEPWARDAFDTFDEPAATAALAVLDAVPGSAVVGLMKAIARSNELYGLTAEAFAEGDDDEDTPEGDDTPGEL
jgi:hypothetical protein